MLTETNRCRDECYGTASRRGEPNSRPAHARFRTVHLDYAARYISRQESDDAGNDPNIGTGGTPFMAYLTKHRDENRAQTI